MGAGSAARVETLNAPGRSGSSPSRIVPDFMTMGIPGGTSPLRASAAGRPDESTILANAPRGIKSRVPRGPGGESCNLLH
jgi:hypothetical protein